MSLDTDKIKVDTKKKQNKKIIKITPGQSLYDSEGNLIKKMPEIFDEPKKFELKPGQSVYDKDGNLLSAKGGEVKKYMGGGSVHGYRKGGSVKNKKAGRLAKRGYGICKK